MELMLLLLVPLIIGLAAAAFGKGKLTIKELCVQEAALLVLISAFYGIAVMATRYAATADTEIWNGRIASKTEDTHHCCHSYPCNCRQECSGSGDDRSCHTVCDTCYRHSRDYYWEAETTNGETVFSDRCNPPGSSPPKRWLDIVIGEPTAVEHGFTNYIKASPESILNRQGAAEKFRGSIPPYPGVYDHYRARRFLFVGLTPPADVEVLDNGLDEINADLGARKQVDMIVIVVKTDDQAYIEALSEAWLGGKKNDLVIAIGAPRFPELAWAAVMSWSQSEEMKLSIRDRIMDLGNFDGQKVLGIIRQEAASKFVRRPMSDFEYLMANVEPPAWSLILIFVLGTGMSIALTVYFLRNDPFGNNWRRGSGRIHRGWR